MQQIITKGTVGQTSLAIVAVVLVLQIVMPYVNGNDPSADHALTTTVMAGALDPLKEYLIDLKALNKNQGESDIANAEAHRRLAEALIQMTGSLDRLVVVVDRVERRVEALSP